MYADQAATAPLESYLPAPTRQPDFDEFWRQTKAQAAAVPLDPQKTKTACPFPGVAAFDICYAGFDGTPIHGWLLLPPNAGGKPLPCLVHYHGFTGSRGLPHEYADWLLLGAAVLAVDCREQGGSTGSRAVFSGGHTTNVVCKGILDKHEYYYRAVYMDCVRAIDFALTCPEIDAGRIIIEGGSQGGALAHAVCALDPRPWLCLADVPSNTNLEQRVAGGHGSFAAVREWLRRFPQHIEQAYQTLSYFDIMNLAEQIRCPVFASVGLLDDVCPAKCYYAAYNRLPGEKHITVYPFSGHEGGMGMQQAKKLAFVAQRLEGKS